MSRLTQNDVYGFSGKAQLFKACEVFPLCIVEPEVYVFSCSFLGDGDADNGKKFKVVTKTEVTETSPYYLARCLVDGRAILEDKAVEAIINECLNKGFGEHIVRKVLYRIGTVLYLHAGSRKGKGAFAACGVIV